LSSPFRPSPSLSPPDTALPGCFVLGARVDADVAALQPPERRCPARLLLSLLTALSLEQRREEEDERRREKKKRGLTGGPINSNFSHFLDLIQKSKWTFSFLLSSIFLLLLGLPAQLSRAGPNQPTPQPSRRLLLVRVPCTAHAAANSSSFAAKETKPAAVVRIFTPSSPVHFSISSSTTAFHHRLSPL